jgi:hypothetical protein
MRMWALCAMLLTGRASAAEIKPIAAPEGLSFARAVDPVLSHPSIVPVASMLIPRSELPLKPGIIENYGGRTPFYANPRFDQVFIDLPRDADAARINLAAAALVPAGKNPRRAAEKIQAALERGEDIPLRRFLPTFAKLWTGKRADCEGPNCINAALLFDGIAERPEYMDDWELENAVETHFRPLAPDERLRVGDLIAFHTLDPQERESISHAARYVGDDFVWHKASRKPETPYTFEKLTHAAGSYVRLIGRKWLDLSLRVYRRK